MYESRDHELQGTLQESSVFASICPLYKNQGRVVVAVKMPSSFFLPKGSRKRKSSQVKNPGSGSSNKKKFQLGGKGGKFKTKEKDREPQKSAIDDEEILSEGSDVEGDPDAGYLSSENGVEEVETAEEKRLRLAKLYLEEIEKVIFFLLKSDAIRE